MIAYSTCASPFCGDLLLVANSSALLGVYFCGCRHAPVIEAGWQENSAHPVLRQAAEELAAFFSGERSEFSLPIHFEGTDFQKAVWREIARIPFGETITYTELAKRAGADGAVRAVGTATGRNPLSIVVPCHRVVGKGGSLTGFAGGLDRKRRLLELEGRVTCAGRAGGSFSLLAC